MKAYHQLHELSKHIKTLQGISSLLHWDQETYMPSGAGPHRGAQLKAMAGLLHREKTSKEYVNALGELVDLKTGEIKAKDLDEGRQRALKEWYRDYKHDTALPQEFVEDFAQLTSQAILVWRKAKENNAFHHFAPFLDKIIDMSRKKADYLGFKKHPYDALLDLYEHDISAEEISGLFGNLKKCLQPLLEKIKGKEQVKDDFLHGSFSQKKQLDFAHALLKRIGYDAQYGRLDFSTHPFSSASHPTDSRITTRINPKHILSNIAIVLHEAGHALYEMGLPTEEFGTPLGEAISLGMHESQSRFWETRIGHSKAFWKYCLPLLQKQFTGKMDDISVESFYKGINKVAPSCIRVEADEVTYSLHVILRFELEKALIEGSLQVRDIPEAWDAKMQELLGIKPKTYADGCLQDIHWAMGAFGYFPSYTLGNLYAAHFFEAFEEKHSDWDRLIEKGEFAFILQWLRENIHQHGRRYSSLELLKKITGRPFDEKAFMRYITEKYTHIYGL